MELINLHSDRFPACVLEHPDFIELKMRSPLINTTEVFELMASYGLILYANGDSPGGVVDAVTSVIAKHYPNATILQRHARFLKVDDCHNWQLAPKLFHELFPGKHKRLRLGEIQEHVLRRHDRHSQSLQPDRFEYRRLLGRVYAGDPTLISLYHLAMADEIRKKDLKEVSGA